MHRKLHEGAVALAAALRDKGLTLACAESLSGGLAMSKLVEIPGISPLLTGGVVCYQDSVKRDLLKIDLNKLPGGSVVSEDCALRMLKGLLTLIPSDAALSLTGNAGPEAAGGQAVGRVYIGYRLGQRYRVQECDFQGDRQSIREMAVLEAYRGLIEMISKSPIGGF